MLILKMTSAQVVEMSVTRTITQYEFLIHVTIPMPLDIDYLKQRVWPEQLHLLVRCFFSIALHADKFIYLLLVGFFSISDQFKRHWLTSLCTGILEVRDNPWLLAIFQLADC